MLPRIVLLTALTDYLTATVAALPSAAQFKVRHHRHRDATEEEFPCVTVKFVSDDVPGVVSGSDAYPSTSEMLMELAVDLIADVRLVPEVDLDEPIGLADDPTGLAGPASLIQVLLGALFTVGQPATTLGGLVWEVRYDGTGNTEESSPDSARMVERLVLVYRVRHECPTELLTGN